MKIIGENELIDVLERIHNNFVDLRLLNEELARKNERILELERDLKEKVSTCEFLSEDNYRGIEERSRLLHVIIKQEKRIKENAKLRYKNDVKGSEIKALRFEVRLLKTVYMNDLWGCDGKFDEVAWQEYLKEEKKKFGKEKS